MAAKQLQQSGSVSVGMLLVCVFQAWCGAPTLAAPTAATCLLPLHRCFWWRACLGCAPKQACSQPSRSAPRSAPSLSLLADAPPTPRSHPPLPGEQVRAGRPVV